LNMLMGTAGLLSLGNAAFLIIGGFTTVICDRAGIPVPVDILIAMLVSAAVGVLVAIPALALHGFYMALATLSLLFIVIFAAQSYQDAVLGPAGYIGTPLFSSYGIDGGQIR